MFPEIFLIQDKDGNKLLGEDVFDPTLNLNCGLLKEGVIICHILYDGTVKIPIFDENEEVLYFMEIGNTKNAQ